MSKNITIQENPLKVMNIDCRVVNINSYTTHFFSIESHENDVHYLVKNM